MLVILNSEVIAWRERETVSNVVYRRYFVSMKRIWRITATRETTSVGILREIDNKCSEESLSQRSIHRFCKASRRQSWEKLSRACKEVEVHPADPYVMDEDWCREYVHCNTRFEASYYPQSSSQFLPHTSSSLCYILFFFFFISPFSFSCISYRFIYTPILYHDHTEYSYESCIIIAIIFNVFFLACIIRRIKERILRIF